MRTDLDRLMRDREMDAFIIPHTEMPNSYRNYITGGVDASALVVKKQGSDPVLVVNGMEVDEAAKSGLEVVPQSKLNKVEIDRKHGSGTAAAEVAYMTEVIRYFEISGILSFYGVVDMQYAMRLINQAVAQLAGQIGLMVDSKPDMFAIAAQTKDEDELEKLRDVGRRTSAVMRATREWLSTHSIKDDQIVNQDGQPLTIGAVKRYVRLALLENDLEEETGMIFAQGRDAGVPHSRGEADEVLRPGESIVFDLFPREVGGGYFHDMTRTWCLGHAPDHIKRDFDLVLNVFHRSLENITLGQPTNQVDLQVCEWFEAAGHPTRHTNTKTTEGYIHGLGHGIGLNVHEAPSMSQFAQDDVIFQAGNVLTVEPGLYYPSKGYGIRVEDAIYLDKNGQIHNLTDCPYDLVVPLNG